MILAFFEDQLIEEKRDGNSKNVGKPNKDKPSDLEAIVRGIMESNPISQSEL
jgi:hypothetical protein